MEKYKVDVPVLLIFFTRDDTFAKVFEKVREAKPSKLFLACDGPRENRPDDVEKIARCKEIASNIDWECEVYTNYSEKNLGCGVRPQSAISWALSIVDRIVILEDDCVPETSFFSYMAELLEKYKDNERIGMVSGLNHFRTWDCDKYSYCFTKTAAIWGWGTWARVWKDYDYTVSSLDSPYVQKLMKYQITFKRAKNAKIKNWLKTTERLKNNENISYWDSQFGYLKMYKGYLSIVPRVNLIHNIGVGVDSTHANIKVSNTWKKGMLHFIPVEPIECPLVHPEFIMCDTGYDDAVDNRWGFPGFFRKYFGKLIRGIKRLFGK